MTPRHAKPGKVLTHDSGVSAKGRYEGIGSSIIRDKDVGKWESPLKEPDEWTSQ